MTVERELRRQTKMMAESRAMRDGVGAVFLAALAIVFAPMYLPESWVDYLVALMPWWGYVALPIGLGALGYILSYSQMVD